MFSRSFLRDSVLWLMVLLLALVSCAFVALAGSSFAQGRGGEPESGDPPVAEPPARFVGVGPGDTAAGREFFRERKRRVIGGVPSGVSGGRAGGRGRRVSVRGVSIVGCRGRGRGGCCGSGSRGSWSRRCRMRGRWWGRIGWLGLRAIS